MPLPGRRKYRDRVSLRGCCLCTAVLLIAGVVLFCPRVSFDADQAICDINQWLFNQCQAPERVVWDTAEIPWAATLRQNAKMIEHELVRAERKLGQKVARGPSFKSLDAQGQTSVDPRGRWRTLWLRVFTLDTPVMKLFPETMSLLNSLPADIVGIMFSTLPAGSCLQPHVGPAKSILRYHLSLRVFDEPENKRPRLQIYNVKQTAETICAYDSRNPLSTTCDRSHKCEQHGMGGSGECGWMLNHGRQGSVPPMHVHYWENGTDFMFDDTYLHAALNPSKHARVILWLDIARPDLNWWGTIINKLFVWAAVRSAGNQATDIAAGMQRFFKKAGNFHG